MKTCSDCLYYEVCQNRYSWLDQEDNTKYITCEKFKNKADFVEVCRCKDCENYNGHRYCTYHADPVLDDDFCSYGEKRGDA